MDLQLYKQEHSTPSSIVDDDDNEVMKGMERLDLMLNPPIDEDRDSEVRKFLDETFTLTLGWCPHCSNLTKVDRRKMDDDHPTAILFVCQKFPHQHRFVRIME